MRYALAGCVQLGDIREGPPVSCVTGRPAGSARTLSTACAEVVQVAVRCRLNHERLEPLECIQGSDEIATGQHHTDTAPWRLDRGPGPMHDSKAGQVDNELRGDCAD
jgi:hypothetical protein